MDRTEAKRKFEGAVADVFVELRYLRALVPSIEMNGISESSVQRNIAVSIGQIRAALDGVLEATDE